MLSTTGVDKVGSGKFVMNATSKNDILSTSTFFRQSAWGAMLLSVQVVFLLILSGCASDGGESEVFVENGQERKALMPLNFLFLGDSLTSGYRLPPSEAYPALIQQRCRDLGLPYTVRNSGQNGDTSGNALDRLSADLVLPLDVLVLALGVNDVEDGLSAEVVRRNLQNIIDQVREVNPGVIVVIAGAYPQGFFSPRDRELYRMMYRTLADHNGALYLEDMLAGVAGESSLNTSDRIHPNARGHEVIADTFWVLLGPVFEYSGAAITVQFTD